MNNVKRCLVSRGISVNEAAKAGMPYMSVYKQYRGERNPSGNFALIYERILGIPRSEIRPDLWPPKDSPASTQERDAEDEGKPA
jgi:hypothetical protein